MATAVAGTITTVIGANKYAKNGSDRERVKTACFLKHKLLIEMGETLTSQFRFSNSFLAYQCQQRLQFKLKAFEVSSEIGDFGLACLYLFHTS